MGRWRAAPEGLSLLGCSASEKCLHPLREFRAGRLGLLEVGLEFQRLLEGRFERMGHGTLRACQRTAWLRCKLTGELAHLLLEAVGWNEAVDDAQPVRVRRRQRLAGEEHLVRDPGSREAREKPAHPAIRSQPDVHERLEQIRLGRRNPYVAREGKARADADRW